MTDRKKTEEKIRRKRIAALELERAQEPKVARRDEEDEDDDANDSGTVTFRTH